MSSGAPRSFHRLRSENPHQQLGRRGFDSRHLHDECPGNTSLAAPWSPFGHRIRAGPGKRGGVRLDSQLLWGSDYPHLQGTFVYPDGRDMPSVTRLAFRNTFSAIPAAKTRRMVGENAIDVYNLDAAALSAIANEIGAPTVDELATPIDAVPEDASITAFRSGAGGWS